MEASEVFLLVFVVVVVVLCSWDSDLTFFKIYIKVFVFNVVLCIIYKG